MAESLTDTLPVVEKLRSSVSGDQESAMGAIVNDTVDGFESCAKTQGV